MQFNVSFDPSVANAPSGFLAAFNDVIQFYQQTFSDPITINLNIGWGEINGRPMARGALGENQASEQGYTYTQLKTALAANAPTSGLGASNPLPTQTFNVATAEAKALGLLSGNAPGVDGWIGFNSGLPFTFDPANRSIPGTYDFFAVATHEISEVLGRYLNAGAGGAYNPLDLFRYSAPGVHASAPASGTYLSADNGNTQINSFNGAPGFDPGDWAGPTPDTFNAFITAGHEYNISLGDIEELHLLGLDYNTAPPTAPTGVTVSGVNGGTIPTSWDPTIVGFGIPGDTVALYDGNTVLGTTAVNFDDTWSISLDGLAAGVHSFTATESDWLGRTSNSSGPLSLLVVPSAPASDPTPALNPAAPSGTTADMFLRGPDGTYEVYNIGKNSVLAGNSLGQVGADYQFAGLGSFNASNMTGMMLHSASTAAFEAYDISSNNIVGAADLGAVGSNWHLAGFGKFNGVETTDMMLRDSNTGTFELYDINHNAITGASAIGAVGSDWQVQGFGDFNGDGSDDMMLRNADTGTFEAYDIKDGQLATATAMGAVGNDWAFVGLADFNGDGTTDMMLRNTTTGVFELYDINNNLITSASPIGAVGLDWQVTGFGPFNGKDTADMVLRNVTTGAFEIYDISGGQLAGAAALGTVGIDWQVGGVAIHLPAPT